ncbi:putative pectinesterase/pectinesterase inhibitor 47 [Apium graveolens]|uniref:putative pectinesterase/pectinesterase inhibitor 47 n=1 Tax=Apium graveolens TaxID=4045 RepID=UPI003D7B217B
MSQLLKHTLALVFLILLPILLPQLILNTQAQTTSPTSEPQDPSLACKSSVYPKLCRSILSAFRNAPSNPSGYGKFTVKQSLKQAKKLSKIIDRYLKKSKYKIEMSHEERNAIEDCGQLFDLTVDYLETITLELKKADSLTDGLIGKIETLLSGVMTNQDTCYDGLVDSRSSMAAALKEPISDATLLYSVSLGLVTRAIGRDRKRGRRKGNVWGEGFPTNITLAKLKKYLREYAKGGPGRKLDEAPGIVVDDIVVVDPEGYGNFTTIGEAVDSAPNNLKPEQGYYIIYAVKGVYQEYITIPKNKKNLMLLGVGINRTVITGNHSVIDGWSTFNSATFAVTGERFVAIDVTFQNTAGPEKHQAVAVRNNADISTFYRCSFEGYQDTLYVHSLRQFYRECDIYGTVDFIFGNSASVFQACNIYARKPMPNQKNAITAQGRSDPNQKTGISIHNCTIQAAPDLALDVNGTTKNYLGRPWKQYSRTVYMQSYIGDLITPDGWLEWNGTVGLDTLYYGEYRNHGPGSNTTSRVQWPGYGRLNATQAWNFTVFNLTLGDTWLPYTTIPFVEGLLIDVD